MMHGGELKVAAILIFVATSLFSDVTARPQDQVWVARRVARQQLPASEDVDQTTEVTAQVETDEQITEKEKVSTPEPEIYSMNIESNIRLRYANTRVTSRVVNPASAAQQTTFHVVLPDSAFISGFVMEINGTSYTAQVKEKEQAQAEYDAAVSQGQSAAQVSSSARDANTFTVSVNIEPASKITFNLTYEELLTRRRGIYEHQIHINPGRIVPELNVEVSISEVLPIQDIKVPQIRNDLQKEENEDQNDLATVTRVNATNAVVKFTPTREQQKKIALNGIQGQFVVQYDVDRSGVEKQGGEIHVIDGYFVHFFAPSTLPPMAKHVVFVLDTSGSMEGTKLEQTKQAMESILDQLRTDDIFSVVEFSSTAKEWDLKAPYSSPEWFSNAPRDDLGEAAENVKEPFGKFDDIHAYPVTPATLARAKFFTKSMRATGGTNINEAMLLALNNTQSVQTLTKLTPMIIFLTDGEPSVGVTSTESIVSNVKKANGDGLVSIFSLAFGSEADFTFLKKISSQNKGFARKIYEASDATLQLKGFFSEVASPLLANVQFNYNGTVANLTETRVGNFFGGTEVVVAGQVDESSANSVRAIVNGQAANGIKYEIFEDFAPRLPKDPPKQIKVPQQNKVGLSLEKTWAYLTIKDLLRKSEIEDKTAYKDKALELSLKYKFVTPVTSLLVIKPNQTSAVSDLKEADSEASRDPIPFPPPASFPPWLPHHVATFAATGSSLGFGAGLGGALNAPVNKVVGFASGPLTTRRSQTSTTTPVPPVLLFPEASERNSTHLTILLDGQNKTLSWEDDLPDKDYQSCNATYTVRNSTTAFCRSFYKCETISNPTIGDYCVIENSHIGVCCVSLEEPETTEIADPKDKQN